jgi:hypothetical protein
MAVPLRTNSVEAICPATGKAPVRKQVVQRTPIDLIESEFEFGEQSWQRGKIQIDVEPLGQCSETSKFRVAVQLADGATISTCPLPSHVEPILLLAVALRNDGEHVLWLRDILPVVVVHEPRAVVHPTKAWALLDEAWKSRQKDVPTAVVPSPYAADDGTKVAIVRLKTIRPIVDVLSRYLRPWDSEAGFVLPASTESFLLAFDLRKVLPLEVTRQKLDLGFYDLVAETSRPGTPSWRTYAIFRAEFRQKQLRRDVGILSWQTTREMVVAPPTEPGTASSDTGSASGSPTSPGTAEGFVVADEGGLVGLIEFIPKHVGSSVILTLTSGEEVSGVLKGLWSMTVSLNTVGGARSIPVNSVRKIQVVGNK